MLHEVLDQNCECFSFAPNFEILFTKLFVGNHFFSRHRLLAIMLPPLNENCSAQLEGKQKDLCCTYGSRKQCGFYFSSPRNKSWELASFLEKAFIMVTFKILMMTRRWPKTGEGEGGWGGLKLNMMENIWQKYNEHEQYCTWRGLLFWPGSEWAYWVIFIVQIYSCRFWTHG